MSDEHVIQALLAGWQKADGRAAALARLGRLLENADKIEAAAARLPGPRQGQAAPAPGWKDSLLPEFRDRLEEDAVLASIQAERQATRAGLGAELSAQAQMAVELASASAREAGDWSAALELSGGDARGAIELVNGTASTDELLADDSLWDEDYGGQLAYADAMLSAGAEFDGLRAAEDAEDEERDRDLASRGHRRDTWERLERSLDRASRGTLTNPADAWNPAADPDGLATCGEPDDLGYCRSLTHTPGCAHTVRSAAATGSYEEAEAWNRALNGRSAPPALAALDANLYEVPDRKDDSYHQLAVRLGIAGSGLSPEGRVRAGAEALARQAMSGGWR